MDTVTRPDDGAAAAAEPVLSAACARGYHRRCTGRVYAPGAPVNGRIFTRCACPTCAHPTETRGRGGPR